MPRTLIEKENLRVFGVDKGTRMNILERRARKLRAATPPIMQVYQELVKQWYGMIDKLKETEL